MLPLIRGQCRSQLRRNCCCDVALNFEYVRGSQFAIVLLRPKMLVALAINQLDVDAHPVTRPLDTGLEDRCHTKLLRNLRDCLGGVFVLQYRRPRGGSNRRDARQVCKQVVVNAIDERIVLGVLRHVGKRQHGDGGVTHRNSACRCQDKFVDNEIRQRDGEDRDNNIVDTGSSPRSLKAFATVTPNAVRRKLEGPGEHQGDRKSGGEQQ